MNSKGFTLIEVIIAIMILAFMSLFTVQAIQNALKAKSKVQGEIDKTSAVRDALRVMERDINMAFNYRDINIQLYNLTQAERKKRAQQKAGKGNGAKGSGSGGQDPDKDKTPEQLETERQQALAAANDPEKFKPKVEKIYTQFIGTNDSLDFTSLANVRLSENSPISSQAEIGYKLKSCRRRSTQEQSSQCLWRRVSNYLHEDITKHGEETVLLENITEFKLRYLGPGKQEEWIDSWSSGEGGDDTTRGLFPYAVEITLAVKDPAAKDKTVRMTTVAAIRHPNNPPQKTTDGQGVKGNAPATESP